MTPIGTVRSTSQMKDRSLLVTERCSLHKSKETSKHSLCCSTWKFWCSKCSKPTKRVCHVHTVGSCLCFTVARQPQQGSVMVIVHCSFSWGSVYSQSRRHTWLRRPDGLRYLLHLWGWRFLFCREEHHRQNYLSISRHDNTTWLLGYDAAPLI